MTRALLTLLLLAPQDGAAEKAKALLRDVETGDVGRAYRAVERLAELGEAALPAVEAAARSADERVRRRLALAADEIRAARDLKATYPPVRRFSISSADKTLAELLLALKEASDLPLDLGEVLGEEDLPKVTVEIKDATPLEALNAICKAGSASYERYGSAIEVYVGAFEDLPRFFFRHFMVSLPSYARVREIPFGEPANEQFIVVVQGSWDPSLAAVAAPATIAILEAADDKGKNLLPPPREKPEEDPGDDELDYGPGEDFYEELLLLPLSPNAEAISVFRGEMRLRFPKASVSVDFEKPEAESRKESGGLAIRVAEVTSRVRRQYKVKVEITGKGLKAADFAKKWFRAEATIAGGRRLQGYPSAHDEGDKMVLEFGFNETVARFVVGADEPPAAPIERLKLTLVSETLDRAIPFEFRDLRIK